MSKSPTFWNVQKTKCFWNKIIKKIGEKESTMIWTYNIVSNLLHISGASTPFILTNLRRGSDFSYRPTLMNGHATAAVVHHGNPSVCSCLWAETQTQQKTSVLRIFIDCSLLSSEEKRKKTCALYVLVYRKCFISTSAWMKWSSIYNRWRRPCINLANGQIYQYSFFTNILKFLVLTLRGNQNCSVYLDIEVRTRRGVRGTKRQNADHILEQTESKQLSQIRNSSSTQFYSLPI